MSSDPPPRPRLERRPSPPPPPAWAVDPDGRLKTAPGSVKLALTGGVASGKSTVAELLVAFGAARIDFDELSRQALAPGTEGRRAAVELFGPKIEKPDGALDRRTMARIIFKKAETRKALEAIVHPAAWRLMLEALPKPGGGPPLTVIEVPLLYEAALDSLFAPTALTYASPDAQLKRLRDRNQALGGREAKRMLAAQLPMSEKLRRADYVVDNDGSLTHLIRRVRELRDRLVGGPPR
ncbi:MAG: dephospho-CoA kinase [Deltaproteobacteria bacterium]|jgi:dephospho-CoA kinase|nr:dephospho-CoA kinase [Deltaproteobacteria bacterium]